MYVGAGDHGAHPPGADYVELPRDLATRARAGLLRDLSPLAAPLRARAVALVHAHFAPDAVFALPLARALGAPLIVTLHGFDVTRGDASLLASARPPLIWSVIARRELARDAAAFVAVSRFIAEQASGRGFPAERLRVLPVGVDTVVLTPGAEPEPGLIVHVGRLTQKKGAAVLIDALARLRAQGVEARLAIVGEGPLRSFLAAQVQRLGLDERVTFHGALPHAQTLEMIRRAWLLAAPSLPARDGDREGLPTVVVEAMALGVPVVASSEAGIPEAVQHGVSGLLVAPGDVGKLTAALADLLDSAELRVRLGAAARTAAENRFDLARQTAALEDLYDRVVVEARL